MHIHRERDGGCHCFCISRCDCQCVRDGVAVDTRVSPDDSLPLLYVGPVSYWPITREVLASMRLAMPTPCKCTDCERMRDEKFPLERKFTIVEKNGGTTAAARFCDSDALPSPRGGRNQDWRDALVARASNRDRSAAAPDTNGPDLTRVEKRQKELEELKEQLGL